MTNNRLELYIESNHCPGRTFGRRFVVDLHFFVTTTSSCLRYLHPQRAPCHPPAVKQETKGDKSIKKLRDTL